MRSRQRPYVVWSAAPSAGRARAYATREAADKAARKLANDTGCQVGIYLFADRIATVEPSRERDTDLRDDYALGRGIGLDE